MSKDDPFVSVRLSRKACELLDEHLFKRMVADAVEKGKPYPTEREIALERRKVLDELITKKFGIDAQMADHIEIIAPVSGTADDFLAVADWMAAEEVRLEKSAPEAVKRALQDNRLLLQEKRKREAAQRRIEELQRKAAG